MKVRVRKRNKRGSREPLAFATSGTNRVAFAWYTPESWARLRATADDAEALDDSYEAWHASATDAFESLRAQGTPVERHVIDVDVAAAWARSRGERFDSASRAAYVTEAMRSKASR